jgi:CubicO group peptidase (beta-lactamase class C family)
VTEAYREPFGPGERHIIHSCTKSIVSAVVGIAIGQGSIPGVETRIGELFPNADTSGWNERKSTITLEDMLTMTTGLETRDNYQYGWEGLTAMRRSPDWTEYALARPLYTSPGRHFEYSNITSYLLSAAVQEATGRSTEDFAREFLFEPLGITDLRWPTSPRGVTTGWGELRMIPTDLAKFGLLYLYGGAWNGTQIVPGDWVRKSWQMHVEANTLQRGYGYQWWIPDEGVYGLGYRGQYLIVNPEKALVVVIVSNLPDEDFYFPELLYLDFIEPATGGPARPLDPATTTAYSRADGPAQQDSVSSHPAPPGAGSWSGAYALSENAFGLNGISIDIAPNGTLEVLTEIYEAHDEAYQLGTPGEFAVTRIGEQDIAVRTGWTDGGELEVLYVGVGEAWWTRLWIRVRGSSATIRARTGSGYETTMTGTRNY